MKARFKPILKYLIKAITWVIINMYLRIAALNKPETDQLIFICCLTILSVASDYIFPKFKIPKHIVIIITIATILPLSLVATVYSIKINTHLLLEFLLFYCPAFSIIGKTYLFIIEDKKDK